MSTDATIRLGIIGAGAIGKIHMNHFGKLPGVELAAVTDASELLRRGPVIGASRKHRPRAIRRQCGRSTVAESTDRSFHTHNEPRRKRHEDPHAPFSPGWPSRRSGSKR